MVTSPPEGLSPVAKASDFFGEVPLEKPGEEGHLFSGAHRCEEMKVVRHENESVQGDAVHSLGPPEDPENEIVDLFGGAQEKTTMLRP